MSELILPLHIISVLAAVATVIKADHYGFSWIRGKVSRLEKTKLQKLHRMTWSALTGVILTGTLLFIPMREFLLSRPQFYIKMAFVLTLVCNGFLIGHLQHIAEEKPFESLTLGEKIPLFISGAVSSVSWLGALAAAFFLVPDY